MLILVLKGVTLFQFHKGAIGVLAIASTSSDSFLFQFHKGAIGVSIDVPNSAMKHLISIP